MSADLKRTPLYPEHVELGARLVPFAGFEMPIQYEGVTAEHRAVRETAGLFDVSHMGEFRVRGPGAQGFVNYVVTNDVSRLDVGRALYTMMCSEGGGIVDDLLVYRLADGYRLVVNAANIAKDFDWLNRWRTDHPDVELTDQSEDIALMALQGPESERILAGTTDLELAGIGYYRFDEGRVADLAALVSRTGYTGEDGFEVYCDARSARDVWRALLESGAAHGLHPAGLGARDTLRLEAGYALYGNDIDESTNPLEARLGWTVKFDKGPFVGRDALLEQREKGMERKLCGFALRARGFPRAGYEVRCKGESVGSVRSGTVGPTLGKGIGTVYLPLGCAEPGVELAVVIRDRMLPAEVVSMPFYTEGSLRR